MKTYYHIIYYTVALITSVACSVEPINESVNKGLSFNVILDESPATKADFMELYSPEGRTTSFILERVPETKSVQINHGVTFTEIYDSFQVEGRENGSRKFYDFAQYNPSTGLWDLQNSSYIWRPGHEIEVIAAASGRDNEQFFNGITYNGNPSTASFNYSLPDTHASQQDYLIGYYKGEIAEGTVSLKFNHPLTSLVFKVGSLPLGVSIQVNSITLEGIDAEAICDVTFGENTTYTWRDHSGTKDYTQVIENATPQGEGEDILDETASFIVIPRTFPANSEARILLSITENGREYDMYAPLAGQTWAPGETNIYEISYHGERRPVLIDGESFNLALANLSGGAEDATYTSYISETYLRIPNITRIVFQTKSDNTEGVLVNEAGGSPIYMNKSGTVITVTTNDFIFYANESCKKMFQGLVNLTSIEGLDKIDTSNAKNMLGMFAFCFNLLNIDVSHFDTRKVTSMESMFSACRRITSLDLSSFNTDEVVSIASMFKSSINLSNINFGDHFQLPKNRYLTHTFAETGFTRLDLSFMLSPVVSLSTTFKSCTNLRYINIENLRGDAISSIGWAFQYCYNIREIVLPSNWSLQNVTSITRAFHFTAGYLPDGEKCKITCTAAAKNVLTNPQSEMTYPSRFEWNIVPYVPNE